MTAEFSLAVHALTYLDAQKRSLTSEELAVNICTNPARVRKVMRGLKAAGLVKTHEGTGGGYELARNAAGITLKDVAEAQDTSFVCASWRSGDVDMDCAVASGLADVMDNIYGNMNRECLEMLSGITIDSICKKPVGTVPTGTN